jgi:hypothetical protein
MRSRTLVRLHRDKHPMPKSGDQTGSRKGANRSQRLEAELKANLRKRKDQARARAEVKLDAARFTAARAKDDA